MIVAIMKLILIWWFIGEIIFMTSYVFVKDKNSLWKKHIEKEFGYYDENLVKYIKILTVIVAGFTMPIISICNLMK